MRFALPQKAKRWLASQLPISLLTLLRYRQEWLYLRGLARSRKRPSVIFYTVHKCASTMTRHLMADLATRHLQLQPLNLVAYLWDISDVPDIYGHLRTRSDSVFSSHGFMYAPLRQFVDTSMHSDIQSFAMLRDPRDVVVSAYFSAQHSHRPPANKKRRNAFKHRRSGMQDISFEGWVRDEAQRVKHTYAAYRLGLPRDRVLTYEQMWHDFDGWLLALATILNVQFSAADKHRYRELSGIDHQAEENAFSHRRKGSPGDYLDKLSPQLIGELNLLFADELHWLYASQPDLFADQAVTTRTESGE